MNDERLAYALMQTAEQLQEIANQLTADGRTKIRRPLTQRERQLCRAAMLPTIQECLDQMQLDFLNGTTPNWDALKSAIEDLQVY